MCTLRGPQKERVTYVEKRYNFMLGKFYTRLIKTNIVIR